MRNKKGIFILVLIILILIVCFIVYFCFFSKDNNVIKDMFGVNNVEQVEENVINDNYNGVYTLVENLGKTVTAFDGCTFSSINNYILVKDGEYKIFRSSCIGTFFKSSGKTKDLDFVFNENTKLYDINYNDNVYFKDMSVRNIVQKNNIGQDLGRFRPEHYKFLLKEIEFDRTNQTILTNVNSKFDIKFTENNGVIYLSISSSEGSLLYNYTANNIDSLPDFSILYDNLVILEKNHISNKFQDKLVLIDQFGMKYNLYDKFPIIVDNASINSNYSIFIDYNQGDKKYIMYAGYNDKLCVDGSTSDSITYYKFEIEYDYTTRNFKNPYFVSFGREKDGCNEMNLIIGD